MDEKIQQLTNEQLLDVIVLVEENKIIQAIQYIASHTAFQYDDAQEIVTELTKRHDAALKSMYNPDQPPVPQTPVSHLKLKTVPHPEVSQAEQELSASKNQPHQALQSSDTMQGIQQMRAKNHNLWILLVVAILIFSFIFYWF